MLGIVLFVVLAVLGLWLYRKADDMTDYAVLKYGEVVNIVSSFKTLTELRETYQLEGYDVLPVYAVPEHALARYEYWHERP